MFIFNQIPNSQYLWGKMLTLCLGLSILLSLSGLSHLPGLLFTPQWTVQSPDDCCQVTPHSSLSRTSRPLNIQYQFCVVILFIDLISSFFPSKGIIIQSIIYDFAVLWVSDDILISLTLLQERIFDWWNLCFFRPLPFISPLPTESYHEASNFWLRKLKLNSPELLFRSNMADSIEIKETKADENSGAPLLYTIHETFFQFSISNL